MLGFSAFAVSDSQLMKNPWAILSLACVTAGPRTRLNHEINIQSTFSRTDTFGTGTKCPSERGVRLIKSQIKGTSKGRDQL